MSTRLRFYGPLLSLLMMGCGAGADDYDGPQTPPPPPPPPAVEPAAAPEPYVDTTTPPGTPPPPPPAPPSGQSAAAPPAPPPPPAAPPPAAPDQTADSSPPLVYSYPSGQWVYTAGRGWVWIPAGATTTDMEGVPYAYLYTPAYGWTWYVSPWGGGGYHYGVWVHHPWHPVGWHGRWVAHPAVVVHLGPGRRSYRRR